MNQSMKVSRRTLGPMLGGAIFLAISGTACSADAHPQLESHAGAQAHLRATDLTIQLTDLVHRYSHGLSEKRAGLLASIRSVIALRADALMAQADHDPKAVRTLVLDGKTRNSMPKEVRSCEETEVQREGILKVYNGHGSTMHYVLEDRIGVKHLLQMGSNGTDAKTGDNVLVSGIQIPCTSMELGMKFADPIVVSSLNTRIKTGGDT